MQCRHTESGLSLAEKVHPPHFLFTSVRKLWGFYTFDQKLTRERDMRYPAPHPSRSISSQPCPALSFPGCVTHGQPHVTHHSLLCVQVLELGEKPVAMKGISFYSGNRQLTPQKWADYSRAHLRRAWTGVQSSFHTQLYASKEKSSGYMRRPIVWLSK